MIPKSRQVGMTFTPRYSMSDISFRAGIRNVLGHLIERASGLGIRIEIKSSAPSRRKKKVRIEDDWSSRV